MGRKIKLILLLVFFSALPVAAGAASLNVIPGSGTYNFGTGFSVVVSVSSAGKAMNGASGAISFPADKLEVVSLSKAGSIISLWVEEPSFSNATGLVKFEGIILNPGFTGSNGKILTINFKAKALGTAAVAYNSGSVLANDGKGTNILSTLGTANFTIVSADSPSVAVATTPSMVNGAPFAPVITSATHPDSANWYANDDPRFSWTVPAGVTAVRLSANNSPVSAPSKIYYEPLSGKELANLEDGTWYLHAQFKNSAGWGDISHFRFRIDNRKPESFEISEVHRKDETDPRPKFVFTSVDKPSGVDNYTVQIDSGKQITWKDDGSHIFETDVQDYGKHVLVARAIDRAGNSLFNSVEFIVKPLTSPVITEWPEKLLTDEELIIKGRTDYPGALVTLYIEGNDGSETVSVKANDKGEFSFSSDKFLEKGFYHVTAEVKDERGAKSQPSEKVRIVVRYPDFIQISSKAVGILAVVVPLLALILILLYIIIYGWKKIRKLRRTIIREVSVTEKVLHKTFVILKNSVKNQIKAVERAKSKRELTNEEHEILRSLKKDLDEAESFVTKEINKIEKEI